MRNNSGIVTLINKSISPVWVNCSPFGKYKDEEINSKIPRYNTFKLLPEEQVEFELNLKQNKNWTLWQTCFLKPSYWVGQSIHPEINFNQIYVVEDDEKMNYQRIIE